jgi:hypothetical protein
VKDLAEILKAVGSTAIFLFKGREGVPGRKSWRARRSGTTLLRAIVKSAIGYVGTDEPWITEVIRCDLVLRRLPPRW